QAPRRVGITFVSGSLHQREYSLWRALHRMRATDRPRCRLREAEVLDLTLNAKRTNGRTQGTQGAGIRWRGPPSSIGKLRWKKRISRGKTSGSKNVETRAEPSHQPNLDGADSAPLFFNLVIFIISH